jgi:hypothetical protein
MTKTIKAPHALAAGIVRTHAQTICAAKVQRTA